MAVMDRLQIRPCLLQGRPDGHRSDTCLPSFQSIGELTHEPDERLDLLRLPRGEDRSPDALLDTYEEERRPIAASVLGLSTELLERAKRGEMRRGREVHQLDIGYPTSSLALEKPPRARGVLAGDRAPDAPILGAGGQPRRLFDLFAGPHWTLLGYEGDRDRVRPRSGLHIHTFGARGDLIDQSNHFRDAYGVTSGDWVLVRPDGYIGAIVTSQELAALDGYLRSQLASGSDSMNSDAPF